MSNPTPGWYPDGSGQQRYWDGNQWTEHTAPLAAGDQPSSGGPATGEVPANAAPTQPVAPVGGAAAPGVPAGDAAATQVLPAGDLNRGAATGYPSPAASAAYGAGYGAANGPGGVGGGAISPQEPKKKSILPWLIVAGVAIIALIVTLVILLTGNKDDDKADEAATATPTTSQTPSEEPSEEPTPTPTPSPTETETATPTPTPTPSPTETATETAAPPAASGSPSEVAERFWTAAFTGDCDAMLSTMSPTDMATAPDNVCEQYESALGGTDLSSLGEVTIGSSNEVIDGDTATVDVTITISSVSTEPLTTYPTQLKLEDGSWYIAG